MKESKEELQRKILEIQNIKNYVYAYRYIIAKYICSKKTNTKSNKVQILRISPSSIEDYFDFEFDNEEMQTAIEQYLKEMYIKKVNIFYISFAFVEYIESIIEKYRNMTDEEIKYRKLFKEIMLENCEEQKNKISEDELNELNILISSSDNLSFDQLKKLTNELLNSKK